MKDESIANFGLLIAYVLPGFVALWGLSHVSPVVHSWLTGYPSGPPSVGGFLFIIVTSIGLGLTASTIRWAILDSTFSACGIRPVRWDFSQLSQCLEALDFLVQHHYRYYQFYGNTLVSLAFAYATWRSDVSFDMAPPGWRELFGVALATLFLFGAWDSLRKFYLRGTTVLETVGAERPAGYSAESD